MNKLLGGSVFFRRISMVSLIAVYVLILVGGIVRSTGSGMGCPDWPKCFGMWIPPTSESELPADYKEKYVAYRQDKINRFANYIERLGFTEKAATLRSDPSVNSETVFNVNKTWTEYINRLIGAFIGLLIILTLAASMKYIKKDNQVFFLSLFLLILVIFQGWIGSVVVSSNLIPWMVTFHMLLAVIIVGILIYLVYRSRRSMWGINDLGKKKFLNSMLIISGLLMMIQILLGTQVREEIDVIAAAFDFSSRGSWVKYLGVEFTVHRSFSIAILLSQLVILVILYRNKRIQSGLLNMANMLLGLVLAEVAAGVIMAYFGIPPYVQPVHLLVGILIVGLQFLMFLLINNKFNIRQIKVKAVS